MNSFPGKAVGPRGPVGEAFYQFCRHLVRGPLWAYVRVRHFDVPDIREVPGGLLIASNHQSFLDPVLVGTALDRPVSYLARRDLFDIPGLGALIGALGSHPVTREAVDAGAVRTVLRLLRSGEPVLVFPEGTRTPDGELGAFRTGPAAIAIRCGVPVVPVCIEGAYGCWPRTRRLPRPGRVAVAFGPYLEPHGATAEEFTARLRAEIQQLREPLRRYLGRAAGQQTRQGRN